MQKQRKQPKITMSSTGTYKHDIEADKKRKSIVYHKKIDISYVYQCYKILNIQVSEIIKLLKERRLL